MYVHIFGYLVNKLEIWWVYLSPIETKLNIIVLSLVKIVKEKREGIHKPIFKTIECLLWRADLNFEFDFGSNSTIGTIAIPNKMPLT